MDHGACVHIIGSSISSILKINFSGKCHNIKLAMDENVLNSPTFSIPMGGTDVVLGVQWLQSLGTVAFNFQEHFLKFFSEGREFELWGIIEKPRTKEDPLKRKVFTKGYL